MNIVLIDGGLGNQLFQIAFALYLRKEYSEPVVINFEEDSVRHQHGTIGIEQIASALGISRQTAPSPVNLVRLSAFRRSLGTRKLFTPLAGLKSSIRYGDIRIYSGYWQNVPELRPFYGYVADACREAFSLRPTGNSSVHIRFGDYTSRKNRKVYHRLDSHYYAAALKHVRERAGKREVQVLSNSLSSAKLMFDAPEFAGAEFRYMGGDALTDFSTISQSTSLVASNSTFCWWGAFISARMGGLSSLVSPKNWFNAGYRHREAPSYSYLSSYDEGSLAHFEL